MIKYFFITVAICLLVIEINAQDSTIEKRSFQASFVYPLGTSGSMSINYEYDFSLNVLIGMTGGVNGFEAAGLINMNRWDVKGAQFAGLGNITGGNVNAVQFAGLGNIAGGNLDGIQGAGLINLTTGRVDKGQFAGLINFSDGLKGVQAAGLINVSSDSTNGLQASGLINVAANTNKVVQAAGIGNFGWDVDGVQAAGIINIAKSVEGFQGAGIINVSKNVKGVQIAGILNVCDSIDGVPIALISVVRKNGYRAFEVSSNEMFYLNTSFRIGIDKLYTILSIGFRPTDPDYNWGYGAGIGTRIDFDNSKYLNVEYHGYQITHNWRHRDFNMINSLRVNFAYQVAEHLAFFAGPSMNVLVSDFKVSADQIAPSWAFNIGWRDHVRGWFGFNLGMRF